MANEKIIKRRIHSATNIAQITRAMQMVAASKMKKAQSLALSGRPYAEKIAEMVARFVKQIDPSSHPLLQLHKSKSTLIVLITTNKGLCGGLNTSLFRFLTHTHSWDELKKMSFVTLGKKGELFVIHNKLSLLADFSNTIPFKNAIAPLTSYIINGYLAGEFSGVYLVYNMFLTALAQKPLKKRLLPIGEFTYSTKTLTKEFLVEPSVDSILDILILHYLENQIRDAVYEAEACEHSARMMAMKNATDNATELIEILMLEYNKARQEKITYEIADMVTARMAIS